MSVHFLTPYLEHALATALGGRQIHVQNTILAWNVRAKSLELRVQQVTVRQHDSTPLATIPTIEVELSAWALLRGTVALTAINIEEVSGVLHRTSEGTFRFGVSSADTPPSEQLTPDAAESSAVTQQTQVIAELVQNLVAHPQDGSPLATLQALQVSKGTLVVHDQRLGATWRVTQFDLTLRRHQHGLTGTGHMTLALQDALTSVDATLVYARATERLTLEATFRDLRPSALATVITDAEALAGLDLPVNGSLALTLDGHGSLETLHFTLASAAGIVSYPAVWSEPLAVSDIVIRGHFDSTAGTLSLDEASVTFGMDDASPTSLRVAGQVEGLGADMTIRGEVALTALPIATLKRLWPVQVGSQARAWVNAQLQVGQVDQALVNVVLAVPGGHLGQAALQRLEGTLRAHLPAADVSARFETAVAYSETTEIYTLDLSFTDLRPAALATVVPALQTVAGLDVPLSGKLAAAVDTRGQWRDLRFTLNGGRGSFSSAPVLPHTRPISSITAQGHFDGPQAALHLDEATVAFGTARAVGPRLSLRGTAQELKHALTLNGQVTLTGLPMAELQDYWPVGVSADARAWLTENLVAGTVEEVSAQVVVTVPSTTEPVAKLERLRGTIRYQGLEVHYLRPLPPATGVSGSASFDQQGFRIQISTGQITDLRITPGTVEITGLDRGRDAMAIRVGLDGPLRTVLTLLNHPQLNLLADFGIDPAATAGQVAAQLGLALPLRGQILLPKVDITVHSTLAEVSIQQVFLGHHIEHGQVTLDLTKAGLTLTGTAAFATVPLTVTWKEAFSTETVWKSDVHVTAARLDPTHLATFGLDLTEFVAGPLAATVTARVDRQGKSTVQATVNLQEAQLTLPWLDWHKPAHAPGEAEGTVQFMGSQAPAQGTLRVHAGTLATNGVFQFTRAAEAHLNLALRDLVVGESRFKAVTITQQRERVDVTLGEGVLDAQPLMHALSSQAEAAAPSSTSRPDTRPHDTTAALVVHLQAPVLHRVTLGDNRYLQDVSATLTHGPEGWKTIDLAARVPEALVQRPSTARQKADQPQQPRTVSVAYRATAPGPYALSVRTNDLGAVLFACALYDGVTGGDVTIAGQTTGSRPDAPLQGTIAIKDFTVQHVPVLARLLAAASLRGLLKTLNSDGLAFTQLLSDFTLADQVLTLRQLRTHGGALGLTAAGSIDIPASSMDVQGTIIPLYRINTVLGKVPIIGDFVLGGKGQGLVAITARVTGRLSDPQVRVNPATAVTPGFLRGFFGLFPGSKGADSDPQPRQE